MDNRFSDAEQIFREALELSKQLNGDGSSETVQDLLNLTRTVRRLQKWDDADPLIRQTLTIRTRNGESDKLTANSLLDLGVNLERQGRLAEAEPYFKQTFEIRRHVFGDDHILVKRTAVLYESLLRKLGKTADADRIKTIRLHDASAVTPNSVAE